MQNIDEQIRASITKHSVRVPNTAVLEKDDTARIVCFLEPVTIFGRQQPVSIEIISFRNKTASKEMICLKTPLGNEESFNLLSSKYPVIQFPYEQEYPMVKICYDASKHDMSKVYMRVDLPLLSNSQSFNPLSAYELNESLDDLVECADLIERLTLPGQDLHASSNTDQFDYKKNEETSQLRKTMNSEPLNSAWSYALNRKYVFLSSFLTSPSPNLAELWRYNHVRPFVKFIGFRNGVEASLAYFSKDIQGEEQNFLEKHFNDVIRELT